MDGLDKEAIVSRELRREGALHADSSEGLLAIPSHRAATSELCGRTNRVIVNIVAPIEVILLEQSGNDVADTVARRS